MKLYLIQHGEATSEQENFFRPLTGKGAEDVKKTASFLAKIGPGPIFDPAQREARGPGKPLRSLPVLSDPDAKSGRLKISLRKTRCRTWREN